MKFTLEDLNPREVEIEVELEGKKERLLLRKFNILAQIWLRREFGSEKAFNEMLDPKSKINVESGQLAYLEALCKTLHHLLHDKSKFPTWENFAESIASGPTEILNLGKALLTVMGLSQPLIDKTVGEAKKKVTEKAKK